MMSRILPVLLVLIAFGLFFGYTNPTYNEKVNALRTEIKSYDAALSAAKRFKEREAQIIAERAAISPEGLARLEAFLPDGVDNVQLIVDLNALADRSGVQLSDFDITESADAAEENGQIALESESPVDSLDLSVTARGSYRAFKTFLEGTEWSLRPLDLVDLTLEDSATGVYSYQMTFRIYWLR